MLDLGAGNGFPSCRLVAKNANINLSILDISSNMLTEAKNQLLAANQSPQLIHGDLNNLVLRANSYDGAISCCTLQFVLQLHEFFQRLKSALCSGGILCLIFYDPMDLRLQLVHKYFPGLNAIDQYRHHSQDAVLDVLRRCSFRSLHAETLDYWITFPDASSYIKFISERPFSVFNSMPVSEFNNGLEVFLPIIRREFPDGPVNSPGRLRLLIAEAKT